MAVVAVSHWEEAGAALPEEVPGAVREMDALVVESGNNPGCTSTMSYSIVGNTPNIRTRERMSGCRRRERTPARVMTLRHSLHRPRLSAGLVYSSCRDTLFFRGRMV